MSEYKMKAGKVGEAVVGTYKKIEEAFTDKFLNEDGSMKTGKAGEAVVNGYKKIEGGVVGGYRKIEDGVVEGYKKIENAFVETFLEKVEDDSGESK